MGRGSIKENKSEYQLCREEQGLTREKASEIISETFPISADKIEKIENDKRKSSRRYMDADASS